MWRSLLVNAPACRKVGPGFESRPGTPGVAVKPHGLSFLLGSVMPALLYTVQCTVTRGDENMLIDGYRRTQDRGLGDYMNGCREEYSGDDCALKKGDLLRIIVQSNCETPI